MSAGWGLAVAFGALFATILFADLAALLVVAAAKGRMSVAGKVGSLIVIPAAPLAIWITADTWANRNRSGIWVPGALPPLVTLYAVRARFALLRAAIPDIVADVAMGALAVVLVGVPRQRTLFPPPPDPAAEARAAKQERARLERDEQAARESQERQAAQFAAAAAQPAMAGRRGVQSRRAARPAREEPARRCRFLAHRQIGRRAGEAQISIVPLSIGTQRPPM